MRQTHQPQQSSEGSRGIAPGTLPEALRVALEALPDLAPAASDTEGSSEPPATTPLQVISKQGRLILRLSAAAEALEARYKDLAARQETDARALEAAQDEVRSARAQVRQMAQETIRLMDVLDWVQESLTARGDSVADLVASVTSAQRDGTRRLAAVGITEIPAEGMMDGRLHEGVDTVRTTDAPRYHIVRVVRRGWQNGMDVLRRTAVVTAE